MNPAHQRPNIPISLLAFAGGPTLSRKRSRVHPPYKTKYRVTNWANYNQALVKRGGLGLWISADAIANWNAKPSKQRRGGQQKDSNLAIETSLTLGLVYPLPLRQREGFVASIFKLMGLHLDVPDHSTLSRRSKTLKIKLRASGQPRDTAREAFKVGKSCISESTAMGGSLPKHSLARTSMTPKPDSG